MEQCEWCGMEMTNRYEVGMLVLGAHRVRACRECTSGRWESLVRYLNEMKPFSHYYSVRPRFTPTYLSPGKWSWEE